MEVRFAIGEVPKDYKRQIAEEERKFGAFLHIPVKVRGCVQKRSAKWANACAELALARPRGGACSFVTGPPVPAGPLQDAGV